MSHLEIIDNWVATQFMPYAELDRLAGLPRQSTSELIAGRKPLSEKTAAKLELATGISGYLLLQLQEQELFADRKRPDGQKKICFRQRHRPRKSGAERQDQ